MARCRGTTKAGERCKRDAREGSGYCGFHEDQATASDSGSSDATSAESSDRSTDLLLVGAVTLALFAVRRILRFL